MGHAYMYMSIDDLCCIYMCFSVTVCVVSRSDGVLIMATSEHVYTCTCMNH